MTARSPAHESYAAAAAALLCTFALLSGIAHADCGGFASTCRDMSVWPNGVLTAACQNGKGGTNHASLDLNRFIGNTNGNLVDGAGFVGSCRGFQWYVDEFSNSDQGFSAYCRRTDGSYGFFKTYYNLQRRVANHNGNLSFNKCRRRSLLEVAATMPASRKMLNHV